MQCRRTCLTVAMKEDALCMGVDFGTSGARISVINLEGKEITGAKLAYPSIENPKQRASAWKETLLRLFEQIPAELKGKSEAIAIDGTSGTALLVDKKTGQLLAAPKMYNEKESDEIIEMVKSIAPESHTTLSGSSTLCKLLGWDADGTLKNTILEGHSPILVHQADWLAYILHGHIGVSDWNNALKLGFDPEIDNWPAWLLNTDLSSSGLLPHLVLAPGKPIASVSSEIAALTGLRDNCVIYAGTTDSIAAFLASGVSKTGQAVTSLGSTLAVKLLSECRVENSSYGIYSHRLGETWLVGGASNAGGAVLRKYFTDQQLIDLTRHMDPNQPTGLDYIALPSKGERFPINDPNLEPKLEPRPKDDAIFLQGMLEALSRVEARGYEILEEFGASKLTEVVTCGGGASNEVWTEMRRKLLGVPVRAAINGEACYGAALLALRGYLSGEEPYFK